MGNVQCTTSTKNSLDICRMIEDQLNCKNSIMESKILQEFYFLRNVIVGAGRGKRKSKNNFLNLDNVDKNLHHPSVNNTSEMYELIYTTSVSLNRKTKMARLIKWFKMAFNFVEKEGEVSLFNDKRRERAKPMSNGWLHNLEGFDNPEISIIGSGNISSNVNSSIRSRPPKCSVTSSKLEMEEKIILEKLESMHLNNYNISILNSEGGNNNNHHIIEDSFEKKVEYNLLEFYHKNKVKFLERVSKGPPMCFRWVSWKICGNINKEIKEEVFLYFLNKEIDEETNTQIKKDLNRTLPDENSFNKAEIHELLYQVLRAFANMDKEVAYCQGMNFIVGYLLIISNFNIVESFFMLISLFSYDTFHSHNSHVNFGIRGFFSDDFPTLKFYLHVFDFYFRKKLPTLKSHFDSLEIPNEVWISKWFQTLFTICLPLHAIARLWDCLLSIGLEFLVSFSLVLLKRKEAELMKMQDTFDIINFFKTTYHSAYLDVEEIIAEAKKLGIDKGSHFLYLKKEYEEKNSVNLSKLKIKYDLSARLTCNELINGSGNMTIDNKHYYYQQFYKVISSNSSMVTTPIKTSPIGSSINMSPCRKISLDNYNCNKNGNFIDISDVTSSVHSLSFMEDNEVSNSTNMNPHKNIKFENINVSNFLRTTCSNGNGTTNATSTAINLGNLININSSLDEENETDLVCNEFSTNELNSDFQIDNKINTHTMDVSPLRPNI